MNRTIPVRLIRTTAQRQIAPRYALRAASTSTSSTPVTVPEGQLPGQLSPQDADAVDPQLAGLDYPVFRGASRQHRNPRGWWDQQERMNFNETLHENDDTLSMWAPDDHKISGSYALRSLLVAVTALAAFGYSVKVMSSDAPVLPRTYPYDGLVKDLTGQQEDKSSAAREQQEGGEDEE